MHWLWYGLRMSALVCLCADKLAAPSLRAVVRHGFFGRCGGVSAGAFDSLNCSWFVGDAIDAVDANRARVAGHLDARRLVTCQQVHSNLVCVVDDAHDDSRVVQADGLATVQAGVALGVLAADCAPVLFADVRARVIGAAHAGWRGALGGIVEAVIDAMVRLGADKRCIVGAIGPAIQLHSYRVSAEFVARFCDDDVVACDDCFMRDDSGAHYFNLPRYVQKRARIAGVSTLDSLDVDTATEPARFFSHRRTCLQNQTRSGRQIGAIVLREDANQ